MVTAVQGEQDFWTRVEKVFKMIVSRAHRRCPRTWWSIRMKNDHRAWHVQTRGHLHLWAQLPRTCCLTCTEANAMTVASGKRKGFIANSTGSETRLTSVSPFVGLGET